MRKKIPKFNLLCAFECPSILLNWSKTLHLSPFIPVLILHIIACVIVADLNADI